MRPRPERSEQTAKEYFLERAAADFDEMRDTAKVVLSSSNSGYLDWRRRSGIVPSESLFVCCVAIWRTIGSG